jgi:DNA-binding MarR family transcriptional regulator
MRALLPERPRTITITPAERRVLAEIVKRKSVRHGELVKGLAIDRGQLSRLLKRLEEKELVVRERQRPIEAKPEVRKFLRWLDAKADEALAKAMAPLGIEKQRTLALKLGEAVTLLEGLKGARPETQAEARGAPELRILQRGEIGLVLHAWLTRRPRADAAWIFGLAHRFLEDFDRTRDIAWVAEVDGKLAGCSLLKGNEGARAELWVLLVEQDHDDDRLARELIEQAAGFAGNARYETVTARLIERDEGVEEALEVAGFAQREGGVWEWREG